MERLLSLWRGMSHLRQGILVGSILAIALALGLIAKVSSAPNMVLLYAGLDPRAAGEIIAALETRLVPYQVRGEALYVEAAQRDQLRLALAAEDLPPRSSQGYELLDQLSGYSTTSQMFDAAYWRAKEGELARTILSLPELRAARVHIGRGPNDVFQRSPKVTASVTVTSVAGGLSGEMVMALRHLVASAVAGLAPADVQVIDTVAGLLGAQGAENAALGSTAQQRAKEIREGVERLLAARVGAGKAVVEVSVDLDSQSEVISERLIDPSARVAISAETQERTEANSEGEMAVGVASNLPDAQASAQGKSQSSETRERINYEVSQTNREISRAAGRIKRITLAVLIDGQSVIAEDGSRQILPRSPEELAALRELVASAAGIDEARGDVLSLQSMEFSPQAELGSAAIPPRWREQIDVMALAKLTLAALTALGLALFVLRPLLLALRQPAEPDGPAAAMALPMAQTADFTALLGNYDNEAPAGAGSLSALGEEEPASRLRRLIGERQSETIEVLRNWLEPEEEKA